ncbi:hypothetical protein E4U17_005142 [Claviceps sp. LM77 group G4]|nr:hypothetical protein E4U17_005142 [Claviceps sp. LM77 group G4]KAG6066462.1 hypothetical protein E4U33_005585 [Claviceps sp. LM78 group G4]KAG6069517.1 hypothetical protein E4U16_007645 [Claviceps sp. LM84 group G4]
MDSSYVKELTLCFRVLRAAAPLSQSLLSPRKDKGAVTKDDFSPVTVADFALQALLIATIQRAFPEDAFVGEEDASALRANDALLTRVWDLLQQTRVTGVDNEQGHRDENGIALPESKEHLCGLLDQAGSGCPRKKGRTWIFDPIDGTRIYLRGGLYAINMALLVDGIQTLGCVGCPNLAIDAKAPLTNEDIDARGMGSIIYAVRGHGAYAMSMNVNTAPGDVTGDHLNDHNHHRLAQVSSSSGMRFVTCASIVDSALENVHGQIASRLNAEYPGCDLVAWVVRWATLAMGLGNTTVWIYKRRDRYGKVWDHAGAMLLFEETGGKITDVMGRDIDLTAGRTMSANFGFVAAPRHLHQKVLDVVREVLKEQEHEEMLM